MIVNLLGKSEIIIYVYHKNTLETDTTITRLFNMKLVICLAKSLSYIIEVILTIISLSIKLKSCLLYEDSDDSLLLEYSRTLQKIYK